MILVNAPAQEDFERGQRDVFRIEAPAMAQITHLILEHNNRGQNAAWRVTQVEVCPALLCPAGSDAGKLARSIAPDLCCSRAEPNERGLSIVACTRNEPDIAGHKSHTRRLQDAFYFPNYIVNAVRVMSDMRRDDASNQRKRK